MLSLFFLMASVLTGFMSNAATAVLLAPLAITSARALGVDERPFLVALTFAASAAFWTPIGYQTNLLVYGPGGYRFTDFIRIGGPLTLLYAFLLLVLLDRKASYEEQWLRKKFDGYADYQREVKRFIPFIY